MIVRACDRLRIYLLQSPTVADGDRALCKLPPGSSDSSAGPLDEQAFYPSERVTSVVQRWMGGWVDGWMGGGDRSPHVVVFVGAIAL